MLPKKNRVNKKEVTQIFKFGHFINSQNLTFKYLDAKPPSGSFTSNSKISFIIPKAISKLAVKRNLLRRKGYLLLRKYIKDIPKGLLGVFIFKKYQTDVLILENEIKNIFSKIN